MGIPLLAIIFWLETIISSSSCRGFQTIDEMEKRHLTSVCHTEFFAVRCGLDEMLAILGAFYGRMRMNRCVRENFGYIGCSDDVTSSMDEFCSGRRSCNVRVLDDTFSDAPPCHEDLNSYLEVEFQCIKVVMPTSSECQRSFESTFDSYSPVVHLASPGFILPSECLSNAGTSFTFISRPGQRFKVTMTDFLFSNSSRVAIGNKTRHCAWSYGSVYELPDSSDHVSICGPAANRRTTLLFSTSDRIRLELNRQPHDHTRGRWSPYLIRIETVGCPDEEPPPGGWTARDEDTLLLGCNNSILTWKLDCISKEWRGPKMNCSLAKSNRVTEHLVEDHLETFVVSLGVLIAAASFSASFICLFVLLIRKIRQLKRQRDMRRGLNMNVASTICHNLSY